MANEILSHWQDHSDEFNKIKGFFSRFNIPTQLNSSDIRKTKGFPAKDVFAKIFAVSFLGKNIYHGIVKNKTESIGKDVFYDFLKCEKFNWRNFTLSLAAQIISFFNDLTDAKREKVLIIDDSTLNRNRSKTAELLARVFDHCENKYLKGYRFLSICWSDGASFIPLDFALLSSANKKSRLQEVTKNIDKRTCGYKRRLEAQTPSTELLEPMVKRILNTGVRARYLLMDSWFMMPKTIAKLKPHIHTIGMIKKSPKIHYIFKGRTVSLKTLYRRVKKKPGKAKIPASAKVTLKSGEDAKIVFVRDRRRKSDWLALLTTDIDLPDEEVVRLYGKRWDIEVFFKMSKQHLGLERGVQTRDFDSQIAHSSIVMVRYMFMAWEQRHNDDPRTFGELFRACCSEIADLEFLDALKRILELSMEKLQKAGELHEKAYQALISAIFGASIDFFGLKTSNEQKI